MQSWCGRLTACLLLAIMCFWSNASLAVGPPTGPSTKCPPVVAITVASGGNYHNDLVCSTNGLDGTWVAPSHGTLLDPLIYNYADYTNNGDGALSDTFTVLDDSNGTIIFNVTVLPSASAITVTPVSLPNPAISSSYSQTLSATGGVAPYSYSISSGSLPAGVSFSSGGVFSGTPTASGAFPVTVAVHDSTTPTALTGSKSYSLAVAFPTLVISPATPPSAAINQPYSQQLSTGGGTAPYTYTIQGVTPLPAGLSLSASGLVSGTPTALGSATVSVVTHDSTGGTGPAQNVQSITFTVVATPPPVAGAVSAVVAYGSSANPITLNLSGGAATSVAVASAAAHGTATASGTSITYTPTAGYGGSDSFTYTATNGGGTSSPATVTVTVTPPTLVITPSGTWSASDGNSYNQTLTWSGGAAPYSALSATGLPAGLSVTATSANSLTISGSPSAVGSFTVAASATDSSTGSGPYTKAQNFTLTVAAPTVSLAPAASTLTPLYGSAYSQAFTGSGGTGPYTYALTGSLPTGLNWNAATGTLSGTPSQTGSFPISVSATDHSTGVGAPFSSSVNYTLSISVPTITLTPVTLPGATVGLAYPATSVSASGGIAPYAYTITSGALPTGLALNSASGALSGMPTAAGTFNFTVRASDANSNTGSRAYSVTTAAPTLTLTPPALAGAAVASAYSVTFSTSGGTAPYSYALIAGTLPSGITLNSSGLLSGTTVQAGSFPITVRATDSSTGTGAPFSTQNSYTLTVAAPTIVLTPATVPGGTAGTSYSAAISASGGASPYIYIVTSGALPAGLTLDAASGALSGTPTAAGTFNFTLQAQDANSFSSSRAYTLVIGAATLTLNPATLPGAAAATAYSTTLTTSGGNPPYTYAITAGSLPSGITLNASSGVLAGTTVSSGSFPVTIRVTDSSTGASAPFSAQNSYTLAVAAPVITLTSTVPAGAVASSYSATVTASGGVSPYTYSITSGALPAGVTLNAASGVLSGTPTSAGSFNFTVRAQDANSFTGSQAYSLVIGAPTLSLTPAALPGASAETGYSTTLTTAGGTLPYTYAVIGGSLPSGISLNTATGVLAGTTLVSGSFPVTIRVTDSSTGAGAPFNVSKSYTLAVAAPVISLAPSTVAGGTVAASYSASISASGGVTPYAYSISAGALPAGIVLNAATGALSGTPTAAGTFNVTVKAVDANGFNGSQAYSLAIGSATLTLNPATLANPTAEAAYSATLTAGGGTAPYTFAVSGGALPSGLSLNTATGVLSGTTNQSGAFNVTISATDSSTGAGAPFVVSHVYALNVGAPTITVTPGTLSNAKANVAYSQQFAASGGIAPYAYTVSAGSLPAGLTLNAGTGVLAGTPTAAGSFSFTVRATDSQNFNGQQAETLTVTQAQPVAVNDSASTQANQPVTVNVTANDSGPITSIAISGAPAHGSAAVSGLNLVYTPAANYFGSDSLSYVATGPGGSSAPATVTVTVTPLAVPVAVAQSATILAGQPVTIHAASGASGGPFTLAAVATPPSAGTTAVNGTDIVYTSVVGSSGDIKFNFTLANAFGVSAPVTATVSVNPMPVVGAHSATVAAGAAVNVDLMAGASGGPFIAANLITVSPASAGSAVIRDVGSAGKPSYQMTFTASSTFAGAAAIGYTLSNAYATSAPGSVAVTVTARRDMSTDPEVIGLLSAQADSARRFASAQISNFTRRLESLHGDGWGRSGFGISLTPPAPVNAQRGTSAAPWLSDDVDRMTGSPLQPNMRKVGWLPQGGGQGGSAYGNGGYGNAAPYGSGAGTAYGNGTGPVLAANDTQAAITGLPDLPNRQDNPKQPLSLWLGGAVDFGQQNVNGRQTGFRFKTNGISLGGDYRVNDYATFGIGGGFSRDSSDVGDNGTKSTAESVVGALYGSLRPIKGVFIDGVLGYGTLNFNSNRYITGDGGFATGLRHGDQLFGAIVSGIEFRQDGWMWSPYGRLELMSATLDQYTETASGLNALTYFKQTVRSTSASLGVRAEGQYASSIGTWVPRARLEFRHQFQGQDDAGLAYADLASAGPAYFVHTSGQDVGNWSAGLGARLVMRNGLMFSVDYNSNINMGNGRSQSIMFALEIPLN